MRFTRSLPYLPALGLAGLTPTILAQQFSYSTSVVTECVSITAGGPPPPPPTAAPVPAPGKVAYSMPACASGDCASCTLASTYTTVLSALCATGLAPQTYTVTETYVGMSSLPSFATPTAVPYGFTTTVETCSACGKGGPVTATVTFPVGGSPYVDQNGGGANGVVPAMATGSANFTAAVGGAPSTVPGSAVPPFEGAAVPPMSDVPPTATNTEANSTVSTLSTSYSAGSSTQLTAILPTYTAAAHPLREPMGLLAIMAILAMA
ncbi:hypothetical protein F4779DRAFT_622337 [Xylariaceae sp. FL0662B]|nr:hypothetical protein F4779DRAFT_622337 [Xylariaceae sp. FL0662B]